MHSMPGERGEDEADAMAGAEIPATEPEPQPGRPRDPGLEARPDQREPGRRASTGLTDDQARQWAVGAHLAGLSSLVGIPGVIGVLVVWLIKKDEHPLVDEHGKEALNFQISLFIYAAISAVLVLLLVGLLFLLFVAIFGLIMPIIAAVKTSNGEDYRYPLTLRLIT